MGARMANKMVKSRRLTFVDMISNIGIAYWAFSTLLFYANPLLTSFFEQRYHSVRPRIIGRDFANSKKPKTRHFFPCRRRDGPVHGHELPLAGGGRHVDPAASGGEVLAPGHRRRRPPPPQAAPGEQELCGKIKEKLVLEQKFFALYAQRRTQRTVLLFLLYLFAFLLWCAVNVFAV